MPPPSASFLPPAARLADLRGGLRLAVDGVRGMTTLVESLHARIAGAVPPLGRVDEAPARGIAGLVYGGVRGATGLVGGALDSALGALAATLPVADNAVPGDGARDPRRAVLLAALNGVCGDHLEGTDNPLAIAMRLQPRGDARTPHVLLRIHGLCMSPEQWRRKGHDHADGLDPSLSVLDVRYNTGRAIATNGAELALRLERALADWPVPVQSLAILGHSMGGLVARSALQQALAEGFDWPQRLRALVFLGTPHHGAPLERGGEWLHRALGVSPYAVPFSRLSGLRSAGITDLRRGRILPRGAQERPLPAGVTMHAIAGALHRGRGGAWFGDGLVPIASALGRHAERDRHLRIPERNTWTAHGVGHLDLLSDPGVAERLHRWLKP
jgi:hypothetical protein